MSMLKRGIRRGAEHVSVSCWLWNKSIPLTLFVHKDAPYAASHTLWPQRSARKHTSARTPVKAQTRVRRVKANMSCKLCQKPRGTPGFVLESLLAAPTGIGLETQISLQRVSSSMTTLFLRSPQLHKRYISKADIQTSAWLFVKFPLSLSKLFVCKDFLIRQFEAAAWKY